MLIPPTLEIHGVNDIDSVCEGYRNLHIFIATSDGVFVVLSQDGIQFGSLMHVSAVNARAVTAHGDLLLVVGPNGLDIMTLDC
jgi:hypothetical protein